MTFNYAIKRKRQNSLLIFMFHQINDFKTDFYPAMPTKTFNELCLFIKRNYTVISPSIIKRYFSNNKKPAAIISFDDGHKDIVKNALPILSSLNIPFNVNINTEIIETKKPQDFTRVYDILNFSEIKEYYNPELMTEPIIIDRTKPFEVEKKFTDILSNLSYEKKRTFTNHLHQCSNTNNSVFSKVLSTEDIQLLNNYKVEFGSHSHTHPILSKCNDDEIHYELLQSKKILENILKNKVNILAYPNGIYNEKVKKIAKKIGYSIFLETKDKINYENQKDTYYRINQYHNTIDEALSHTYGMTKKIKKIISARI